MTATNNTEPFRRGFVQTDPVQPGWILLGSCLAVAAKYIEPPFYLFYPPSSALFGAGWTPFRIGSSFAAVLLVLGMLIGGYLGDQNGRRRYLLIGLVATALANGMLLLSNATAWHVTWRIAAIISSSLVLPLALSSVYLYFQDEQQFMAIAAYSASILLAVLVSPYAEQLSSNLLGLRGTYLLPFAIAFVAFFVNYRYLPESRARGLKLRQAIGGIGWTLFALALIFGLIWVLLATAGREATMIVTGIVLLAVLLVLVVIRRRKDQGRFAISSRGLDLFILIVAGTLLQIGISGSLGPIWGYLAVVLELGSTMRIAGMMPIAIGVVVAVWGAVRIVQARSVGRMLAIGMVVLAVSIFAIGLFADTRYLLLVLPLFLFGLAILVSKTVWTNGFFQTVRNDQIGIIGAISNSTTAIGGALGALLGTALLDVFGSNDLAARTPELSPIDEIAPPIYDFVGRIIRRDVIDVDVVAAVLGDRPFVAYQQSYVVGFSQTLFVIAAVCLLGAAVAYIGLRPTLVVLAENPSDVPELNIEFEEEE